MQNLQSIISSHISTLYSDILFSATLSAPPKPEHGEYCFGVFTLAKPLSKSPNQIAEEIASKLREDTTHFTQVNVIGGYVNLSCAANVWMDILSQVENQQQEKKNQTIVVDYIGANAGKPLHIGHICTPSIGQAICNIYRHLGYYVIGDSHFGDWGGIFGKLIWSFKNDGIAAFSTESDKISYRKAFLNNLSIDSLLELYQSFHIPILGNEDDAKIKQEDRENGARIEFKKLVSGDFENVELWKKFTAISITEIEKKLGVLEIKATYNIGESFYEGLNLPRPNNEDYPNLEFNMKDIVRELIEKGVATQNEDGSVGVVFPEESKIPSCILQKKDGTGLYLTSDLAAIKYRMTNGWNPSKIIYCVDVRQQLHLRQAIWIAKKAWGLENVELFHAFNGFIKLKEGTMSTRHGTVIFLEDLITEGEERTSQLLAEKGRTGDNALSPEDIEAITIGAIKYSYLSQDREKDVTFDWDKALSFEGNSGPYIQYACVRAAKIVGTIEIKKYDYSQIEGLSPYDTALIRTLAEMEAKIQITADTYKPHTLALYCYDLAVCFNSFYVHTPKILEESDADLKNLRLTLCRLTADKLTLGFDLLAIQMPSEM
ncbi:arginine--tRNA ligase [Candidatus Gracilibacteria bacterium]|nr:arginine--tRNA ligase [Candidatus Gracilibacteria bacterium]